MFAWLRTYFLPAFIFLELANYGSAQVRLINPAKGVGLRSITPTVSGNGDPQPLAPSPAFGNTYSQTFTFTFTDQNGWQALGVVDVLINDTLDGQGACYFALVPTGSTEGTVYLADDAGPDTLTQMSLPGSGMLSNSQCSLAGTGASVSANSTTVTLILPITFNSNFSGHKAFYLAAQDTSFNDSGWQPLATWTVPGAVVNGPGVTGMSPARSTYSSKQTYTFTVTDTNGWQDLTVIDVLINSALEGRSACYFALVVSETSAGTIYLVNDGTSGTIGYAAITNLPSSLNINNSQCTLNLEGASVNAGGDTLILNMPITFSNTFTGNKLFFVGAREADATSGWQAIGSLSLP